MTHPEELLAGYVDGTLTEPERAVVDAHLASCPVCREEVELARGAVTALASLEEAAVPFGVTGPVLAEAGRRFERRRDAVWQRVQWAAGAAVAAALVLVVVVNMGNDDGDDLASAPAAEAAATGATGSGGALEFSAQFGGLERLDADFDVAGVDSLAKDEAARAAAPPAASISEDAGGMDLRDERFAAPGKAIDCIRRSGGPVDDPRDVLVRLIEAEFRGTPAYLAVFLEGPGAGQDPDAVLVWVASTLDCTPLNLTSQRI